MSTGCHVPSHVIISLYLYLSLQICRIQPTGRSLQALVATPGPTLALRLASAQTLPGPHRPVLANECYLFARGRVLPASMGTASPPKVEPHGRHATDARSRPLLPRLRVVDHDRANVAALGHVRLR